MPATVESLRLAEEASTLVAAAPQLMAAEEESQRAEIALGITGQIQMLDGRIQRLRDLDASENGDTGIINQIRGCLLERGVEVLQGLRFLRIELPRILANTDRCLSPRMVRVIGSLAEDRCRLDERIDHLSSDITALARQDARCERLMNVPGIGPIISSAMVAAIRTGDGFCKGRDFAAWLGVRSQTYLNWRPHHPWQDIEAR